MQKEAPGSDPKFRVNLQVSLRINFGRVGQVTIFWSQ